MPNDPRRPRNAPPGRPAGGYGTPESGDEYRRRMEAKAKRRKKRQMQRLLLIAAFVLAAVLLVVCIIAIFRAIFGGEGKDKVKSSSSDTTSISVSSEVLSGPGYSWTIAPDPTLWNLILVNGQRALPDGFELTTDQMGTIAYGPIPYYFDARIMESLQGMIDACNTVEGHTLKIISGYRGASNQNERYNYLVTYFKGQNSSDAEADILARQIDPPAGYSDHQTGLAVDFVTGSVNEPGEAFAGTPEYAWLSEHAHEYGFVLRYPQEKENITGIKNQPYHWRYVGIEEAKIMKTQGTCLEEYLAFQPDSSSVSEPDGSSSTPTSLSESSSDTGSDTPG
ncbi:D-alanyl-D-alanine carboxypeptidase family protein [Ruminococcaceae bacterium OttesenSCG-928-D13]|nr:D-alanyl-D-alanine carboxypeptidase family protein [Ruminococcaceae bacterium OttesenSCG-928-D13]